MLVVERANRLAFVPLSDKVKLPLDRLIPLTVTVLVIEVFWLVVPTLTVPVGEVIVGEVTVTQPSPLKLSSYAQVKALRLTVCPEYVPQIYSAKQG